MPHTQILFRDDARAKLSAGASLFAGVLLLSEATLTEIEEKHEELQPAGVE